MKEEEVNRCQIQEWYPKFKNVSFRTLIRELPESFVEYLLQVREDAGDVLKQHPLPSFPGLEVTAEKLIKTFGGEVFPKLNWSSPKDSALTSTAGTLRCTSFSEIALLLRSSNSLVHDLSHAYDLCSDKRSPRPPKFFLALREWYSSLQPEMEFRCFVQAQHLVGISQRDVTKDYPALIGMKWGLKAAIQKFFMDYVRMEFDSENYTFDVYITQDGRVKLVDFNPWGAVTLPLLFTWDELENLGAKSKWYGVEFRIVADQGATHPDFMPVRRRTGLVAFSDRIRPRRIALNQGATQPAFMPIVANQGATQPAFMPFVANQGATQSDFLTVLANQGATQPAFMPPAFMPPPLTGLVAVGERIRRRQILINAEGNLIPPMVFVRPLSALEDSL